MALSMYQASVPVIVRELKILIDILKKGEASAEARKIDPAVFIHARLAPDMFPLLRQVQIATDVVKGGVARLAGAEVPSFPDVETSFADLYARVEKIITFVEGFSATHIDGSESKPISLKVGGNDMTFTGQDYLFQFVLPNLFFHMTTTYALLRHNGVPLGKKDYLGAV